MHFIPKQASGVEALPIWEDDHQGAYIERWLVYPAGGPYDLAHMRYMNDAEFRRDWQQGTIINLPDIYNSEGK